jgi:hypothetical protein
LTKYEINTVIADGGGAMGFVIRLHVPSGEGPQLIGRVPSAGAALQLLREWRDDNPDSWVEFVQLPNMRPSGHAA